MKEQHFEDIEFYEELKEHLLEIYDENITVHLVLRENIYKRGDKVCIIQMSKKNDFTISESKLILDTLLFTEKSMNMKINKLHIDDNEASCYIILDNEIAEDKSCVLCKSRRRIHCPKCEGSGQEKRNADCKMCDGSGKIACPDCRENLLDKKTLDYIEENGLDYLDDIKDDDISNSFSNLEFDSEEEEDYEEGEEEEDQDEDQDEDDEEGE